LFFFNKADDLKTATVKNVGMKEIIRMVLYLY